MTTTTKPKPKAPARPKAPASTMRTIAIDRIDRNPGQPRKYFDEAALNELAGSLKELGLLMPITVRDLGGVGAARRYEIVAGERRWRAAKIAGLTHLDAKVITAEDGDPRTFAKSMAENLGRVDMSAMEEAQGFKDLLDWGIELPEVARMCAKTEAYVGWRIDLLGLIPTAQEAVQKKVLPLNTAWYVAKLSPDNQARFLVRWGRGEFATIRETEAFVKQALAAEKEHAEQGEFFVLSEEAKTEQGPGDVQEDVFGSLDLPQPERDRLAKARKEQLRKVERLAEAGAILAELAVIDVEELALVLGGAPGGVGATIHAVDALGKVVAKAVKNLRDAKAAAAVRASAIVIDPALVTDPAPEPGPAVPEPTPDPESEVESETPKTTEPEVAPEPQEDAKAAEPTPEPEAEVVVELKPKQGRRKARTVRRKATVE